MRYMLFAGSNYYPDGGMGDLYSASDDFKELQTTVTLLDTRNYDWYHIYDMEEKNIVARGSC